MRRFSIRLAMILVALCVCGSVLAQTLVYDQTIAWPTGRRVLNLPSTVGFWPGAVVVYSEADFWMGTVTRYAAHVDTLLGAAASDFIKGSANSDTTSPNLHYVPAEGKTYLGQLQYLICDTKADTVWVDVYKER